MYGNSWKEVSPSFRGPWKGVPKIRFRCEADVREHFLVNYFFGAIH